MKFLFIVFFVFIVCLSISIFIKHYFGLDGDYLSAFTTLVAAVVAFNLYSDWREQYVLDLIRESDEKVGSILHELINSTQDFRGYANKVVKDNGDSFSMMRFEEYGNKFVDDCELFLLELDNQLLIVKNVESRVAVDYKAKQNIEVIIKEVENKIKDFSSLKPLENLPVSLCTEVSSKLGRGTIFEKRLRDFRYSLKNNINFVVDGYINNKGA